MLAIRLQRLGRKAMPVYRLAVQEAQRHPSSGRVVAYVGTYNPHTKAVKVDKEKTEFYLKNGAQPTPRVVRLLIAEKIDLPKWVAKPRTDLAATIRKPEKLRKNRPAEAPEAAPAASEEASEAKPAEEATDQSETADVNEPTEVEQPAEEAAPEAAEAEIKEPKEAKPKA